MNENYDPFMEDSDPKARILPPDYSLKEKIGHDIDAEQVFTKEAIEKAQESIEKYKDSFLSWVMEDLRVIEEHFKNASSSHPPAMQEIEKLEFIASRIKAQAGTFGFGLATLVAKSLCSFCNKHQTMENDQLIVIRKHIDTLLVIFNRNITGDGGAIGNELLDSLSKLTEKYYKA